MRGNVQREPRSREAKKRDETLRKALDVPVPGLFGRLACSFYSRPLAFEVEEDRRSRR